MSSGHNFNTDHTNNGVLQLTVFKLQKQLSLCFGLAHPFLIGLKNGISKVFMQQIPCW